MEEYDVADCFLNTPRKAVLASVEYRLRNTQERTRAQLRASPSAKIARQKIIAVVLHRFISSRSRLSRCLPPARGIRTTTTSSKRWPGQIGSCCGSGRVFPLGGTSRWYMWSWWRCGVNFWVSGLPPCLAFLYSQVQGHFLRGCEDGEDGS